jgi:hypothetical protein
MDNSWFNGVRRVRRTPASGGYDKRFICGDLIDAEDAENWPLCCECKDREGWSFDAMAKGKCKALWDWWDENIQVLTKWKKYNNYNKQPIILFTKKYDLDYIMCDSTLSSIIIDNGTYPTLSIYRDGIKYDIFILEQFLSSITIDELRKLAESTIGE